MFLKILIVVVFFLVTLAIGIYCRRHAHDVGDFVLGGRQVGPWLSAFAYGTTYFSAVVFVGYAGQFGWKYGMAATWIGLGNAIIGSLLAWYILGPRTRAISQKMKAMTMPEFFRSRYHSRTLGTASALIVFIFLIPYTASVYSGLSRLFDMAFGVPYIWCIIGMAVLTCIYVVLGGYMATVLNDFIQGIIMLVGIAAVVIAVINGFGGFTEAMVSLSQVPADPNVIPLSGAYTSIIGPDPLDLLGVLILTSIGTWGLPQMVTKFYAIKKGPAIKRGAIISTIFALIVSGGCYFLGGFGRLLGTNVTTTASGSVVYDSIIPTLISGLPDVLVGIVVVLVLSASMSTLASLVMTSSTTITLDVIKEHFSPDMKEKNQITWIRVLLVLFVLLSAIIAAIQYTSSITFIAQLMSISWGALAGSFLGPFVWGLYSKRITPASVWASFIFAIVLVVGNMVLGWCGITFIASPIVAGAFAMVASLIIVPVVSLFTPQMDKAYVDDLFGAYKNMHSVDDDVEELEGHVAEEIV